MSTSTPVSNIERRFTSIGSLTTRAESNGRKVLEGRAIKYNSLSSNLGGFVERIAPGAFKSSINAKAVKFCHNHDTSRVLGSMKSGTLTVRDDSGGLNFCCYLPDSAADVWESINRRDTEGVSFGFQSIDDDWEPGLDPETGERTSIRTVKSGRLHELSTTAWPAYPQTDVSAAIRSQFPNGLPDTMPMSVRSHLNRLAPRAAQPLQQVPEPISDEEFKERAQLKLKLMRMGL
jgi:HK97 family phage prohead protease